MKLVEVICPAEMLDGELEGAVRIVQEFIEDINVSAPSLFQMFLPLSGSWITTGDENGPIAVVSAATLQLYV